MAKKGDRQYHGGVYVKTAFWGEKSVCVDLTPDKCIGLAIALLQASQQKSTCQLTLFPKRTANAAMITVSSLREKVLSQRGAKHNAK